MSIVRSVFGSIFDPVFRKVTEPSSGRAFNPSSLFGPTDQGIVTAYDDFSLLFQDNLETTPVTAVGQTVGCFGSQVNGHKFVQATASSRGVLRQDGSGKYYLEVDGVNDSYASSAAIDFSGSNKMTHLWFGRIETAGVMTELSPDFNSVAGTFILSSGLSASINGVHSSSRGTVAPQTGHAARKAESAGSLLSVAMTHDISGDLSTIAVNGVAGTNGTADKGVGNFANAVLYKFRRNNTSFPFGGDEYAEIIINRALTASEIAKCLTWGNKKMGVV